MSEVAGVSAGHSGAHSVVLLVSLTWSHHYPGIQCAGARGPGPCSPWSSCPQYGSCVPNTAREDNCHFHHHQRQELEQPWDCTDSANWSNNQQMLHFIICSSQPSARSNINVCWDEFMKIATELWNSSSELLARSNQFTLLSSDENENLASDFKRTMQLTCVWCNKRRRLNNNFNPTTFSSDLVGGRGGEGGVTRVTTTYILTHSYNLTTA